MTRILVVDDDQAVCDLFRVELADMGLAVETTRSGVQAASMLDDEVWDVLITDIVMPDMDGFDLIRLAGNKARPIPAIAMTGYEDQEITRKLLETNCFGFVTKPFEWSHLFKLIQTAIRSSRRMHRT